jgi:hypothetical protein
MKKESIQLIVDEISKRPEFTTYIVKGSSHKGKYNYQIINVKISKHFLSGRVDNSPKNILPLLMLDTIESITAIDWNKDIHEEVKTLIYKR